MNKCRNNTSIIILSFEFSPRMHARKDKKGPHENSQDVEVDISKVDESS